MSLSTAYRGRFAPTPSGPLHAGSLVTALASWLAARQAGGEWWLRIDDLDTPRCVPGAEATILRQLEAHGLHWDGTPWRQSSREAQYRAVLQQWQAEGLLYYCQCTRARLAATSLDGPDGPIYAGTCRHAHPPLNSGALRWRASPQTVAWQDGIRGLVQREIPSQAGDAVLQRADGLLAYHLACALDEPSMGITEVVRGDDLLGSTVPQLLLMDHLGAPRPRYAHLPVLCGADGRKLSKQNGAAALATDADPVSQQLSSALAALGHPPPPELNGASPSQLLGWALQAGPALPVSAAAPY